MKRRAFPSRQSVRSSRTALAVAASAVVVWVWIAVGPTFLSISRESSERASTEFVDIPMSSIIPGDPYLYDVAGQSGVVHVALVAAPARLELVDGVTSEVFAYNGRVPGPTLELMEGERVTVRFRNELPQPTTVHWHGLSLPIDSDGSPLDPVPPGEERFYTFTVLPGSAGTYWYHPHPHHETTSQITKGLYGAVVIRAPDDPLPSSFTERLLVLSDNRILSDGSFDLTEPTTMQGQMDHQNGREGALLFVNGEIAPTLEIRSGEIQRWRIVNASASRVYRLAIPEHTFLHVGSDGGLFEYPIEVDELLIANAERMEVLVRGTGAPGSEAVLETLPYDRYMPQTRPSDWDRPRELLTLRYANDPPVTPDPIPETLRPIPHLDPAQASTTREIVMAQGMINNRLFDMNRVDVSAPLGATEIWLVHNVVGMDHPFHLHGFQFQILDRNGVPEPFRSWKDTVNVPKHETVRFIVRFADNPGKWMFHCHILDHEDQGMMGIVEVT
jgi:FtsP/CotA-like multicopper oxidase with cupredoxin domain